MNMRLTSWIPLFLSLVLAMYTTDAWAQSLEYDKQLGRASAIEVANQMGIADMPVATAFLDSLGSRLVSQLGPQPFEYSFYIVDMDEPNAFALPGGYIFVSRGLLWLINNEDQLAGVVGHEIIHSHKRHSVKSQRKAIFPALLQLPGAVAGGIFGKEFGEAVNSPFEKGGKAIMASYGRKQEKESDRLGIELSALSGYEPEELAVILEQISKEVELLTGEQEKFSYFNDHPLTPERVEDIQKRSRKVARKELPALSVDREDLLKRFDGMLLGEDPAQGIFRDSLFLHPELDLVLAFPEGWATEASPVMVGAFQPDKKAQLLLSIAGEAGSPEQYGAVFTQKLAEKYRIKPNEALKVEANGHSGYLVSLIDSSTADPMAIHILWMNWENVALQFVAVGYESYRSVMKESIMSLRNMSEAEKESLTQVVMRLSVAKEGETLTQFAERTNNLVNAELLALFNNLEPDSLLKEGQVLKIAVEEPYR